MWGKVVFNFAGCKDNFYLNYARDGDQLCVYVARYEDKLHLYFIDIRTRCIIFSYMWWQVILYFSGCENSIYLYFARCADKLYFTRCEENCIYIL